MKTFNEIKNLSKRISEMKKLIQDIENFDNLKKFRMFEKKKNFEIAIVDNRIKNMIKTMKKMTLNVNAFMQEIAQHQKNQFKYLSLSFENVQIARRPNQKNQFAVASIFQIEIAQNDRVFYQNNQFMNSNDYQRFSQRNSLKSFSNKCLYCYRNDHLYKKECRNFNDDLMFNKIHIIDRKLFFGFFRPETIQVRM